MTNQRGAPKGNLNALKHGFYSRLFHSYEANTHSPGELTSLENEIKLLRVMIRRTMELADGVDDLQQATRVLYALGAASTRLSALMRVHKNLNKSESHLGEELSIAIQRVNEELRSKK